jgi:hypothetical protein
MPADAGRQRFPVNMKKHPLLLSADPADGGDSAATVVKESDAKESDASELVRLRREIEERDSKLKLRETRLSELEDENRTLKTPPKKEDKAIEKSHWLAGWTPFG